MHSTPHPTDAQLLQDLSAKLALEASSFLESDDPPLSTVRISLVV